MTGMDWIAAGGLFLAFLFTLIRTELLNPRLGWGPSAPFVERLAWDGLAACAGLRGWMIWSDVVHPTGTEAALAGFLAAVTFIGMGKVLFRAFWWRFERWLFGGW